LLLEPAPATSVAAFETIKYISLVKCFIKSAFALSFLEQKYIQPNLKVFPNWKENYFVPQFGGANVYRSFF
jgi:hypothetical protein